MNWVNIVTLHLKNPKQNNNLFKFNNNLTEELTDYFYQIFCVMINPIIPLFSGDIYIF